MAEPGGVTDDDEMAGYSGRNDSVTAAPRE
jgi:hypothetical protein